MQDLTPQLRTRLSRVERVAGIFVALAVLLLLAGFAYYVYHTAQRKGWLLNKVKYFTYVDNGAGLKVGDPVKLMGFDAGQITLITGEDPSTIYNVYVEFIIRSPYYGYIWYPDSRVKVTTTDLLGNRFLEVTKGGSSGADNLKATVFEEKRGRKNVITGLWDRKEGRYGPFNKETKPYYLQSDESPAITERLENIANQIEHALPGILALTNSLAAMLDNASLATSNANRLFLTLEPLGAASTNLAVITAQVKDPHGSLGEWLLPTNLHARLLTTLAAASATVTNADTNLSVIASNLNVSLEQLAALTASFRLQVEANTNILAEISRAVISADELMQGLKRHWLLRGAFRSKTNAPPRPKPAQNPAGPGKR